MIGHVLSQNVMKTALTPAPPPQGFYESTQDMFEAVGVLAAQAWVPTPVKLAILTVSGGPMFSLFRTVCCWVTRTSNSSCRLF